MNTGHWILGNDGEPERYEGDAIEWAAWFEKADRCIARTTVGVYDVSTVFLGIDHNFSSSGRPLLFETMVFTPDDTDPERWQDHWCRRHASRAEAYAHHERVVESLRANWKPDRGDD